MSALTWMMFFAVATFLGISCAEKPGTTQGQSVAAKGSATPTPKPKNTAASGQGVDDEIAEETPEDEEEDSEPGAPAASEKPKATGDADVCGALQASSGLSDFSRLITDLCGSVIGEVRQSANIFSAATDTPKILVTPAASANNPYGGTNLGSGKSQMKLATAMSSASKAKSVFNMLKLQLRDPGQFEKSGFETGNDAGADPQLKKISSTAEKVTTDTVTFHYLNKSEPNQFVEYRATSKFFVLKDASGQEVYVVATKLTEALDTIEDVLALQIVSTRKSKAEMLTYSDQIYRNNNNHNTTVQKAISSLGREQKMAFNNALNADKANTYIKD